MSYILAKNELHHRYWRRTTKPTVTISTGTEADGHGFVNSFDDNAATSLKISGTTQLVAEIDFGESVTMNGFAIYGHNFANSEGIKIEYASQLLVSSASWDSGTVTVNTSTAHNLTTGDEVELSGFDAQVIGSSSITVDGTYTVTASDTDTFTVANAGLTGTGDATGTGREVIDYNDFEDTGSLYSGTYTAADNFYRAYGAYIDQDLSVRRLKITTVGWDTNTFMSNFAIGRWVDGVNISAPFTPPIYEPQMAEIKRNNKGNPLLTDTRKMPQKFSINLTTLTESDIFDAIGFTDTINGHSANYGFAEYFGYYLPRFPFYLMYDDGEAASTDAEKIARRNRIWYAVLDNQSRQPSYNTPTTLNWRIPVVGYIS